MALQKSFSLPNGISGNYWRCVSARVSIVGTTIKVSAELGLFVDAAHAVTTPIMPSKWFEFTCQRADITGDIIAFVYGQIKAANDPDLVGAIDV